MSVLDYFTINDKEYHAWGEYCKANPPDIPLSQLLNLKESELKPFTKDLLKEQEIQDKLSELSRGVRALYQFQDILDIPLDLNSSPLINRHYLYFECLIYLRESIVSWLDMNVLAALTMLRPFLELAVLYLYWFVRCDHRDYSAYYKWLKEGNRNLSFQATLNSVINAATLQTPSEKRRLVELKQIVRNIYYKLSTYNHVPSINESVSGGFSTSSLDDFMFYVETTNILLHQVIYLYILTHPMALFPVERHSKWGFGGPKGIFFDFTNYYIVERYLGKENIAKLQKILSDDSDIKLHLEWYNKEPNMTSEQIDADWLEFVQREPNLKNYDASTIGQKLALAKSIDRCLNWALNYVDTNKENPDISDTMAEEYKNRMTNW
jgi:hypothetical protein